MIRRSPAEAYLKYLIVHPNGYSNDQIKDIVLFAQLDALGNWYLNKLRDEMSFDMPKPFLPNSKSHKPSQSYIYLKGLHYFFMPDEPTLTAFRILEAPLVKEFVETTIISHAPFYVIADALTRSKDFACKPMDIKRYHDLFWNMTLLDRTEFKHLLHFRSYALSEHPDPEIAAQAASYKEAIKTDARRAASELPFSPISSLISQVRMGLMPSVKDFARMIEMARVMAVARAVEHSCIDKGGDHMKFKSYASGAMDLTNVLATVARPEEDLRNQLASIAMKTDNLVVPTLKELGENSSVLSVEAQHEHIAIEDQEGSGDQGA